MGDSRFFVRRSRGLYVKTQVQHWGVSKKRGPLTKKKEIARSDEKRNSKTNGGPKLRKEKFLKKATRKV